jgi:MFS family permease
MIFMTNAMSTSQTIQTYQKQLPQDLQLLYQQIREERTQIFYTGYIIGFILALAIILYNTQIKKAKMGWPAMVCLTVTVAFITNYFYYILTPKTKWMLDHIENLDQTKSWLQMYKSMQTYYHSSLVFGIIAIGLFAFAFRC